MSERIIEANRKDRHRAVAQRDAEVVAPAPQTPHAVAVAGFAFPQPGPSAESVPAVPGMGIGSHGATEPRLARKTATIDILRRRANDRSSVIRRKILVSEAYPANLSRNSAFAKLKADLKPLNITYQVFGKYYDHANTYTVEEIRRDLEKNSPPSTQAQSSTPPAENPQSSKPRAEVPQIIDVVSSAVGSPAMSSSGMPSSSPAAASAAPAKGQRLHLDHRDVGPGTSTNPWEAEIGPWVKELYWIKEQQGGVPTREDFLREMKARYRPADVDQPAFAYALQWAVRLYGSGSDTFREDTKFAPHKKGRDVTGSPLYQAHWTIRHYTPGPPDGSAPTWMEVKSSLALGMGNDDPTAKKTSGHTNDTDWHQFGNAANTFHVLCINGELASNQEFLGNCHWYAEFNVADINDLWVSSDWLITAQIKGDAFRGTGKQVKEAMIRSIGTIPVGLFLKSLASNYNNLEVKVPGQLQVKEWKKK